MNSNINSEKFNELYKDGTTLLRKGQTQKALPKLKQAHDIQPEHVDAALNLSAAYILVGKFKSAVPILEELTEKEPQNEMIFTNLGAAYLGNPVLATDEEQKKSIDAFKQALKLNPKAPNVAYNLGLIYRDRGENEEAIFWFREALQANPQDTHAKNILDKLISSEEKYD